MAEMTGVRRQFVRAAMAAPFLEREEERELAVQWKDHRNEQALHRLAHAHMRLVIALATRFRHYGLPIADLIQEGHVGLLEAAARFEPEREVRFSTYATWWIRASMQDYTPAQLVHRAGRHEFRAKGSVLQSSPPARSSRAQLGRPEFSGVFDHRAGDRRLEGRRRIDGYAALGA